MVLDIIILLIILISAFIGKKTGIAYTVINLVKWLAIIILSILLTGPIKNYLIANTTVDDWLNEKLGEMINANTHFSIPDYIPDALSEGIGKANDSLAMSVANSVVGIFMTLIALLIVILLIGITTAILSAVFSKKHNKDNIVGKTDGFIGLAFGIIRGALIVFLFLALLMPVSGMFFSDSIPAISSNLDSSVIAGYLYDNNPLLLLLNNVIGG